MLKKPLLLIMTLQFLSLFIRKIWLLRNKSFDQPLTDPSQIFWHSLCPIWRKNPKENHSKLKKNPEDIESISSSVVNNMAPKRKWQQKLHTIRNYRIDSKWFFKLYYCLSSKEQETDLIFLGNLVTFPREFFPSKIQTQILLGKLGSVEGWLWWTIKMTNTWSLLLCLPQLMKI